MGFRLKTTSFFSVKVPFTNEHPRDKLSNAFHCWSGGRLALVVCLGSLPAVCPWRKEQYTYRVQRRTLGAGMVGGEGFSKFDVGKEGKENPVYTKGTSTATSGGAGIAQWLEHRTRDWKVAGSNPCWNGGRIFFSRVDFLCWLLFRYPFHPRVTTVARKKSRSFCQKRCRWQVTAKHAYTLRMWILLNRASALVTTCP